MALQRYEVAGHRAVEVATTYEKVIRGATVESVEHGLDPRTRAFLATEGVDCPFSPSTDLISTAPSGNRLIEVKGRGGRGPIKVYDRQLETMRFAPDLAWLYVVFEVTQPQPVEMFMVERPADLPWIEVQAATRPATQARGVRHMAIFEVSINSEHPNVRRADLSALSELARWMGSERD